MNSQMYVGFNSSVPAKDMQESFGGKTTHHIYARTLETINEEMDTMTMAGQKQPQE